MSEDTMPGPLSRDHFHGLNNFSILALIELAQQDRDLSLAYQAAMTLYMISENKLDSSSDEAENDTPSQIFDARSLPSNFDLEDTLKGIFGDGDDGPEDE